MFPTLNSMYCNTHTCDPPWPLNIMFSAKVPTGVPQPGVMARWRPDLQGKQRPESLEQFKRDGYVYVTTSYISKVQGFKVNLYDNPDPKSGYRPGLTPVERTMGTATVFLGIPYALPPVKEGRFKVGYCT